MHTAIDFADLVTQGAREVVPITHERGLSFLYDYRGPIVRLQVDEAPMRQALRRLFSAAIDILQDGFVFFTTQVSPAEPGAWSVAVVAAASGSFVPPAARRAVLERMELQGIDQMTDEALLDLRVPMCGTCPWTGGQVGFSLDANEGSLFSLELQLDGWAEPRDQRLDAAGARAWLVCDSVGMGRMADRRLQRLGWATRVFGSLEEAAREAERMPAGQVRPALVVAYETDTLTLQRLRWLWALLPPSTQVVLAVRPDSPTRAQSHGNERDVEVRVYPFSPAELRQFTLRTAGGPEPSGETLPAPLAFEQRRRALVVDDNAVNQMVATGMLQVLGFEVDTASDGEEAIDSCMRVAPDLVLMDLHMPGMDGLEATRRLRLLQREGTIPRFPILAATADTTSQEACEQAGMDAHLPKPLNLAGLEIQLRRLLPQVQ